MYATQIVKYINAKLKANLSGSQFQQGMYFGLAKQVVRNQDNTPFIVIFDNEGNDLSDFINDKYSITVYHRMTGQTFFPVEQNQATSFGDGAEVKGTVMNMVMVVYGDRNKLKMTNEELCSLMYVYFPTVMEDSLRTQLTGLQNVNFSPVSSNNISAQVSQSEGITCEVENILFSINYQIREQIDANCIEQCDYTFNSDSLCFEMCAPRETDWVRITTTLNTYSYTIPTLGGTFTLTDTSEGVPAGLEILIAYKNSSVKFVVLGNLPLMTTQYTIT